MACVDKKHLLWQKNPSHEQHRLFLGKDVLAKIQNYAPLSRRPSLCNLLKKFGPNILAGKPLVVRLLAAGCISQRPIWRMTLIQVWLLAMGPLRDAEEDYFSSNLGSVSWKNNRKILTKQIYFRGWKAFCEYFTTNFWNVLVDKKRRVVNKNDVVFCSPRYWNAISIIFIHNSCLRGGSLLAISARFAQNIQRASACAVTEMMGVGS